MSLPFFQPDVPEMTVQILKDKLSAQESLLLLDVRQPEERDIASLGGVLIPLSELSERIDELEPHRSHPIIVYCRSGARSRRAVEYLRAFGFDNAVNLKGGILEWSRLIDPSVPVY